MILNKPKKIQIEPKFESKMIARVNHDDIKVWEPRRQQR